MKRVSRWKNFGNKIYNDYLLSISRQFFMFELVVKIRWRVRDEDANRVKRLVLLGYCGSSVSSASCHVCAAIFLNSQRGKRVPSAVSTWTVGSDRIRKALCVQECGVCRTLDSKWQVGGYVVVGVRRTETRGDRQ